MALTFRADSLSSPLVREKVYRFTLKAQGVGAVQAPLSAIVELGRHGRVVMTAGNQPGTQLTARNAQGVLAPIVVWAIVWAAADSVVERRSPFNNVINTVRARVPSTLGVLTFGAFESAPTTSDGRAALYSASASAPLALNYGRLGELAGPSIIERATSTASNASAAVSATAARATAAVSAAVDTVSEAAEHAAEDAGQAVENGITYTKILLGAVAVLALVFVAKEAKR